MSQRYVQRWALSTARHSLKRRRNQQSNNRALEGEAKRQGEAEAGAENEAGALN